MKDEEEGCFAGWGGSRFWFLVSGLPPLRMGVSQSLGSGSPNRIAACDARRCVETSH
jgi:hypothetical protein